PEGIVVVIAAPERVGQEVEVVRPVFLVRHAGTEAVVRVRNTALDEQLAVVERQRQATEPPSRRDDEADRVGTTLLVLEQLVRAANEAVAVFVLRQRAAGTGRVSPGVVDEEPGEAE